MSTTYITNPPLPTPAVTVIPANEAPNPLPPGGAKIAASVYFAGWPPVPTDYATLSAIACYQGQTDVPASQGTGGAFENQLAIDNFNQRALNYQAQQKAAWEAAGEPSTFTPTAPAPVADPVPYGPVLVIMDSSADGSSWIYPPTSGPLAGVCPPFVAPVRPVGVPYIKQFMGLAKNGGKSIAVFALVAGMDTVTQNDPTTTLVLGETYGLYTYDGKLGAVAGPALLNVTKQYGAFGASYYYSDPL